MSAASRLLIPLLAFLSAFAPLTTDMYLPAFGQLAQDFGVDSGRIQGTLTTFFVGMCAGQLLYGPLIDRWGRRGPLLVGVALYMVATAGCIFTRDINAFSAFRLLQAVGGCGGMIVARAIVRDLFTPVEGARAMSLMMMVVALAPAAAPVVGGWVLALGGWHAIFGVLFAYGAACWVLTWRALPETLAPDQRQPISVAGIARGYAGLLREPAFRTPALVGALALAALFSYITASSSVAMELYGLSGQQYGLMFGSNALGLMVASQVNRMALRRWSVPQMLQAGLVLGVAAAVLVLAAVTLLPGVFLALAVPLWFSVASVGLIGGNAAVLAMSASGPRAGSASALVGALQFLLAAVFSGAVAASQNGTAWPMALAMMAATSAALLMWWRRRR